MLLFEAVILSAVLLFTANDNSRQPGCNPMSWKLLGRNELNDPWKVLWTVVKDVYQDGCGFDGLCVSVLPDFSVYISANGIHRNTEKMCCSFPA